MSPYPNLRHIRLFAHAAQTGSLSRAAETVRVSQPAASQAIAGLEAHFCGDLFERSGNGVFVTERGRIVAARAARIIDMLRAASARLARQGRTAGTPPGFNLLETHATIAHLRGVDAFARAGSFSAAARRMGQTEPSVQRAARELERVCGAALFEGRQQSVRLTPAGIMIASSAGLMLKELESAAEEVRELEGRFEGRVVVGTLPLVRTSVIPDTVTACVRTRPGASIEILDGSYDSLLHSLTIGEIDMIVGALREEAAPRGLAQEVLFLDGLSVIARAGHPLALAGKVGLGALSAYPWALPRKGTPTRAIFDMLADGGGFSPSAGQGIIETGSLVALRGILISSDRLTLMSRRQIAYEERAGLLAVIDVDLPPTERPIGLTTRAGWKPTLLQSEFVAALRRAAAGV